METKNKQLGYEFARKMQTNGASEAAIQQFAEGVREQCKGGEMNRDMANEIMRRLDRLESSLDVGGETRASFGDQDKRVMGGNQGGPTIAKLADATFAANTTSGTTVEVTPATDADEGVATGKKLCAISAFPPSAFDQHLNDIQATLTLNKSQTIFTEIPLAYFSDDSSGRPLRWEVGVKIPPTAAITLEYEVTRDLDNANQEIISTNLEVADVCP